MNKRVKGKNYPVVECFEARIGSEDIIELILGIILMFVGFVSPVIFYLNQLNNMGNINPPSGLVQIFISMLVAFSIFGIMGLVFFINFLKPVFMILTINKRGKEKKAVVCEYLDDDSSIDDFPTQIVKLLIEDKENPIYVYYQLGTTERPYPKNAKIKIKMYRHIFRIINDK